MRNTLAPLRWLARHPVAQQYPVRTWSRWAYWQVRQRITKRPKIIPFVNGTRLAVYPHEGLTAYWYLGFPEFEEMMFLLRFLRPGDVFFDIGANAGAFTVLAASLGCPVVAFEPVPQTFHRLQENVILNRELGSIVTFNRAVGEAAGSFRMTTEFGTGNHVLKLGEDVASVEVPVLTLNDAMLSSAAPAFVKIDVEGHELEVIKGAGDVLHSESLQGLLVETFRPHNWKLPKLRAMEAALRDCGFFPCDYNVKRNEVHRLENPQDGGNNTFYLRTPGEIEQRLRTAKNAMATPS